MSLLYATGFDYFSSVDDLYNAGWKASGGVPLLDESVVSGAHSRQSLELPATTSHIKTPNFNKKNEAIYLGFWVYIEALPSSSAELLTFSGLSQARISIDTDGAIYFTNISGTLLGSKSDNGTITINTWYYVEVKYTAKASISADDCIIRVDETEVVNLAAGTDTDFDTASPGLVYSVTLKSIQGTIYYDDLVIYDGNGSQFNDFMGKLYVATLRPSGNGNSSQWVGSDADSTDNYLHVDETERDDDTSYIEADAVGDKDLYAYDNLPAAADTIKAVAYNIIGKKSGDNYRTVQPVARIATTDYNLDDVIPLDTDYLDSQLIQHLSPASGTAWTVSEVNGAEFGLRVAS